MFILGNGLVDAHRTTVKSTFNSVFRGSFECSQFARNFDSSSSIQSLLRMFTRLNVLSLKREHVDYFTVLKMSRLLGVIGEFLISFDCGYNFDLLSHIWTLFGFELQSLHFIELKRWLSSFCSLMCSGMCCSTILFIVTLRVLISLISLTLYLPWVTKREFLLTISSIEVMKIKRNIN